MDKNKYHSKEEYQDLWEELEPRLIKKSSRRKYFFFLFVLCLGVVFFAHLPEFNAGSSAETTKAQSAKNTSTVRKQEIIRDSKNANTDKVYDNTKQNRIYEDKNFTFESDQVNKVSSFTVIDKKNPSLLYNDLSINPPKKSTLKNSVTALYENSKTISENNFNSPEPTFSFPQLKLTKTRSLNSLIPMALYYIRDSLELPSSLKLLSSSRVKDHNEPSRFSMSLGTGVLIPFTASGTQITPYGKELEQSLSSLIGMKAELGVHYNVSKTLRLGIGLEYAQLWEAFTLDNKVTITKLVENPEAFTFQGNPIPAEQWLPVDITQKIRKYNSYRVWSVVPSFSKSIYIRQLELTGGLAIPLQLSQAYSGTLLRKDGLITYEDEIFEAKRFSRVGLSFSLGGSYAINSRVNLGLSIEYRYFRPGTDLHLHYTQPMIRALGLGISVRYRL